MEGAGFEPAKPVRAAILQTAPINHSGTPPATTIKNWVPQPERGFEPTNLPITNRLRYHCATRALPWQALLTGLIRLNIIKVNNIKVKFSSLCRRLPKLLFEKQLVPVCSSYSSPMQNVQHDFIVCSKIRQSIISKCFRPNDLTKCVGKIK